MPDRLAKPDTSQFHWTFQVLLTDDFIDELLEELTDLASCEEVSQVHCLAALRDLQIIRTILAVVQLI